MHAQGGGGRAGNWRQFLWAWPLPPPGLLTFICEWPAVQISVTRRPIDAQEILDAAARAQFCSLTRTYRLRHGHPRPERTSPTSRSSSRATLLSVVETAAMIENRHSQFGVAAWRTGPESAGVLHLDHCDTLEIVPPDLSPIAVEPPDLPELELRQLDSVVLGGRLELDGALVEHEDLDPVRADRILVTESELRGVAIDAKDAPGLRLSDVILRACDLSNVDGRGGSLRRVEIHGSRLLGFGLTCGTVQDLRVFDSSLALASLAFSKLRDVIFERVDLAEASFMDAQLESVTFIDCKLVGTDFRGVKLKSCAIRGTSLDGILGVDCLRGAAMPWVDVLDSAGALAAALGINVEPT